MEALETAISYWYEVLEAYQQQSRAGGTLAIPSAEEAEFTAHLQELLDDAYRLQEQGDQLFHDEVSRANLPRVAWSARAGGAAYLPGAPLPRRDVRRPRRQPGL